MQSPPQVGKQLIKMVSMPAWEDLQVLLSATSPVCCESQSDEQRTLKLHDLRYSGLV